MPVPYSFKNASGTIPLSQLDDNFAVTALSADLSASSGASLIGIIPTPTISSTTVANAINELDTEKATTASVALKADTSTVDAQLALKADTSALTSGLALKTNITDLSASTGATLVGTIQSGTGAVARTVDAKLKETVSVKDFGAVGDGVTNDTVAIQNAINYCNSLPYGGTVIIPDCSNYYSVSRLISKSKVTIIVPNRHTRIVSEKGTTWDTRLGMSFGGFFGNDLDTPTGYAISGVLEGDLNLNFTTPTNSSNFIVGDVVWLEATTGVTLTVGVNTYYVAAFTQLNVVTSVSSGVIGLRHPIHEDRSNCVVRNYSRTGLTTVGGTTPLEAVRDFKLLGGTWVTSTHFHCGGGCIDSEISPDVVISPTGCIYGDAYSNVVSHIKYLQCTDIPLALASGSHFVTMTVDNISVNNTVLIERLIEISEASRDCTINVGSIVVGASVVNLVDVIIARRNTIVVGSILAKTVTGALVRIYCPNFPSMTEVIETKDNYIQLNSVRFATAPYAVALSSDAPTLAYLSNNIIEGNSHGTISGGFDLIGTNNSNIINFKTTTWKNLYAVAYKKYFTAINSSISPYTLTTTIPHGNLKNNDQFFLYLNGVATGYNSTKIITVAFAGTTVFTKTIAALPNIGFTIKIYFQVNSNTIVTAVSEACVDTVLATEDVGVTGLNLSTTDYDIVLTVTAPGADTVFQFRTNELSFFRETARL